MDFASSTRAAETGQDGKGLLRIHLWCPYDLPRLWDRIDYNRIERHRKGKSLGSASHLLCPKYNGPITLTTSITFFIRL